MLCIERGRGDSMNPIEKALNEILDKMLLMLFFVMIVLAWLYPIVKNLAGGVGDSNKKHRRKK